VDLNIFGSIVQLFLVLGMFGVVKSIDRLTAHLKEEAEERKRKGL